MRHPLISLNRLNCRVVLMHGDSPDDLSQHLHGLVAKHFASHGAAMSYLSFWRGDKKLVEVGKMLDDQVAALNEQADTVVTEVRNKVNQAVESMQARPTVDRLAAQVRELPPALIAPQQAELDGAMGQARDGLKLTPSAAGPPLQNWPCPSPHSCPPVTRDPRCTSNPMEQPMSRPTSCPSRKPPPQTTRHGSTPGKYPTMAAEDQAHRLRP